MQSIEWMVARAGGFYLLLKLCLACAVLLWAALRRRLGPEQDQRRLQHFKGRVLWEFEWQQGPGLLYTLKRIP